MISFAKMERFNRLVKLLEDPYTRLPQASLAELEEAVATRRKYSLVVEEPLFQIADSYHFVDVEKATFDDTFIGSISAEMTSQDANLKRFSDALRRLDDLFARDSRWFSLLLSKMAGFRERAQVFGLLQPHTQYMRKPKETLIVSYMTWWEPHTDVLIDPTKIGFSGDSSRLTRFDPPTEGRGVSLPAGPVIVSVDAMVDELLLTYFAKPFEERWTPELAAIYAANPTIERDRRLVERTLGHMVITQDGGKKHVWLGGWLASEPVQVMSASEKLRLPAVAMSLPAPVALPAPVVSTLSDIQRRRGVRFIDMAGANVR